MKVRYHCETCNHAHDNPQAIFKCETCGTEEICNLCRYGPYNWEGKKWWNCYDCASMPERIFRKF